MVRIDTLVFNPFQVNSYLAWDEDHNAVVIDPAFYSMEERQQFEDYITGRNLRLSGLVNTHCHVDHVLGINHCKKVYNLSFRAHILEAPLVSNAPVMGEMFGLSLDPIPEIEEPISDGERIEVGGFTLESILVPGHSPGSLAFYCPEGRFLVSGDALFQGSIGRTDLPGGDYDTLIESISRRLLTLPPETVVYPGHGGSTTIGEERASNPFLNMAQ
jgi:hydroxyacylglutathione hydrolase